MRTFKKLRFGPPLGRDCQWPAPARPGPGAADSLAESDSPPAAARGPLRPPGRRARTRYSQALVRVRRRVRRRSLRAAAVPADSESLALGRPGGGSTGAGSRVHCQVASLSHGASGRGLNATATRSGFQVTPGCTRRPYSKAIPGRPQLVGSPGSRLRPRAGLT
jgi:hypothetical protein